MASLFISNALIVEGKLDVNHKPHKTELYRMNFRAEPEKNLPLIIFYNSKAF